MTEDVTFKVEIEEHNIDVKPPLLPTFDDENVLMPFEEINFVSHHVKTHLRVRPSQCRICKIIFKCDQALMHHVNKHHEGQKPFICNICEKTFTRRHVLNYHRRSRCGNWHRFKCSECGQRFKDVGDLRQHVFQHDELKMIPCPSCSQLFRGISELQGHLNDEHESDKLHECSECDRRYVEQRTLIRHVTHDHGIKPFSCDICHERFDKKIMWRSHMVTSHYNAPSIKCVICDLNLETRAVLIHHMFNSHMHKKRNSTEPQKRHYTVRLLECDLCGATFRLKKLLIEHFDNCSRFNKH